MQSMLIKFLNFLGNFILEHVPSLGSDSALEHVTDAIRTVISFVSAVNFIVPIDTILLMLSILVGYKLVMFGIFVVNWIIRRVFDAIP